MQTKDQKQLCDKFGAPYQPVRSTDMIAYALQTTGCNPVYGVRVEKHEADDVEWFIYCGEFSAADDFYQPIHAHHLKDYLPFAEKYLGLGTGYRFIIDADGYEDVWYEPAP